MDSKKKSSADLEKLKPGFIKLGIVIGLSVTLIAFEWNTGIPDWTDIWIQKGTEIQDVLEPLPPVPEQEIVPPKINMSDFIKIMEDEANFEPTAIPIDWGKMDEDIPLWVPSSGEISLEPEGEIEIAVEEMPRFGKDGIDAFYRWVQERVRYPEEAAANMVQGKVFIMFVVEKDGSLSNIEIIKSPHPSLSDEVVSVVKESPKWTPGYQLGYPARVRFSMNINFVLK